MKKLALAASAVALLSLLGGCVTFGTNSVAPVVTEQYIVVADVPEGLYNCPIVKNLPNPDTLTNKQIADLILKLDKNNHICKESLDSVHKYIADLKARAVKLNNDTKKK